MASFWSFCSLGIFIPFSVVLLLSTSPSFIDIIMKAIASNEYGGPDTLKLVEIPKPEPGPFDLLVKIHAVAVNPIDCKRLSNYGNGGKLENGPLVVGWDAAGVVEGLGSDVKNFKVGDQVMFAGSLTRQEFCLVDYRITGRMPKSVSYEEAASVPLTGLTAWEGLEGMLGEEKEGGAKAGEGKTILVIAGAGGVGSLVIPLAKQIFGLTVIATASRPESSKAAKEWGADHVINHRNDLKEELKGVDYIFNCYNTSENFDSLVPIINPEGKICCIVGPTGPLNIGALMFKKVTFVWELMFTRPIYGVNLERQGYILNRLASLIENGQLEISSRVSKRFPAMKHLAEAHRLQDSHQTIGKIVLTANFD